MRRVLFDEDVPRQLRRDMPEFDIRTVQEEGWSPIKNGELLRRRTFDARLPRLRQILPELRAAIRDVQLATIVVVGESK